MKTFISYPPCKRAKDVALLSLVLMLLSSVLYWEDAFGLAPFLDAVPEKVFQQHEYWRLFTAMFIHSDTSHFLGNAISFTFLSFLLFGYFGSSVFPIAALTLGACANMLSLLTYPPETHLLGMSGAIYVMNGFWLTLYFSIDRRLSVFQRLLRTVGTALVLLVPSSITPGVSYRTHAIGFVLGILFGGFYFLWKKDFLRAFEEVEIEV